MHKIHSIRILTQALRKNQVMLDVDKYIKQLMCIATSDELQISIKNMKRYIIVPTTLKTVFCILQDELDRGFRTIYLESMEARVCFDKDVIKQYKNTIEKYQA